MIDLIVKGLVIFAAVISVAYVFARITQSTGSFTKGILAVSLLIDFYLIILWILGIDRPLFQVKFTRIGASLTITALTIFIPLKLLFTIYLFIKSRQLQATIG
ncbi:MAG: hypothetical protein DRO12_05165 [Thermoprotei archaeon]|nr:MAG: hypothetical protein DRO12_05165 [Thermoprotei archaeon]